MKCPKFETLIDHLDSRLAPVKSEDVRAHLASRCRACSADRAWYETVKRVAASDDSIEPPQWVLKRAFRLFETRTSQKGLAARAGRLIATLVFDSFARPAEAGARSADMSDRQLLYRTDEFGIDLQIASAEKPDAQLTGQILCEKDLTFESVKQLPVTLLSQGKAVANTFTNERGEFSVTPVDCGEYDLQIEVGNLTVTIVSLSVG
jgi:hypothetical protein